MAPEEHVLLLVMHHIACDGWSFGVLVRELQALYAGETSGVLPTLGDVPIQYADFAQWQRSSMRGEAHDRLLDYWKRQLADVAPSLDLPADRPRPAVRTARGACVRRTLPSELVRSAKGLGRRAGTTLFMTLLAAFDALLVRYSGQRDIVVGSPIAGRSREELEPLIGLFVNPLALRVDAPADLPFERLLERVRETCLGAFAHQDLPFEQVVDLVRPERDLSRTPSSRSPSCCRAHLRSWTTGG